MTITRLALFSLVVLALNLFTSLSVSRRFEGFGDAAVTEGGGADDTAVDANKRSVTPTLTAVEAAAELLPSNRDAAEADFLQTLKRGTKLGPML